MWCVGNDMRKKEYICKKLKASKKMLKKFIWGILLLIWGFLVMISHADAKEIREEELYARAAVLMDADSGRVLYGKNEQEVLAMASTTKIMTCIIALENGELALTIDCGSSDFFYEVNKSLHNKLLARKIDHDFTIRPGGHTWKYWINSIDFHIMFFDKFFKQ